jgi:hypothetical protein
MAECPSLSTCPFFNDKMANMPGKTISIKKKYCLGNNSICARYMVASKLGKEKVPSDLFPEDVDRANEILDE